jgi:hypothetical protein
VCRIMSNLKHLELWTPDEGLDCELDDSDWGGGVLDPPQLAGFQFRRCGLLPWIQSVLYKEDTTEDTCVSIIHQWAVEEFFIVPVCVTLCVKICETLCETFVALNTKFRRDCL